MARIGYARVSTTDQDLDIQIGRLKNAGCEIIRSETGSGASRSGRTELETIMQFMHTGDELVVLRLDRRSSLAIPWCSGNSTGSAAPRAMS